MLILGITISLALVPMRTVAPFMSSMLVTLAFWYTSVSYTHLDVYKRQAWRSPRLVPVFSARVLSGLDVYKRQDDQVTEGVENAEQALDGINGKTVNTYIKVTTVPGGGDVDGSHAGGLDRVPFDGYIAQLHAGEAVLTRSEASLWRAEKAASLVGLSLIHI